MHNKMEFEGIIYNKSNRLYKFLGYFGFFFYFQIFSMIFFSHYYSEMEHTFFWFKHFALSLLALSLLSYITYVLTPKYQLFNTVEPLGTINMDNETISIESNTINKLDVELLEFTGQNYPQIKGGRFVLYSSDGSNNRVLIRTKNIELKRKFLIPSESELNKLVTIAKKWSLDGVNIKASFDLK
jgi:hypothetical protein